MFRTETVSVPVYTAHITEQTSWLSEQVTG